ncbi:actinodin1 [Aplochiton taeniatus]
MAEGQRTSFTCLVTITLLATLLLPELLSAGPVAQKLNRDGGAAEDRAVAATTQRRLIRNRRNISWYKQHADFWSWYKFFTDNGNQEAVQELDRVYLAYLQNKNRAEGRRSYKAYLSHLGDIYKSCSDSEDPNCVASYTTRPKEEPPKPAPLKTCDPTKDPYCLYAALVQGKSPYLPLVLPVAPVKAPAPASAKAPAPLYVRSAVPVKDPASGHYYYSPMLQPFLSKEQKAELLRICSAEDVECLQYHLRAAFGYKPSAGPLPSYAHLGCDPKADPNCKPKLLQKTPAGLYLNYPNCDPLRDPYCAYAASLQAARSPAAPRAPPGSCNPLLEDDCNPLSATRFASPPEEYQDEHRDQAAAPLRAAPAPAEQRSNPFAMFRDAHANGASGERDPYAAYRHAASQASPPANDPFAMYRQAIAAAQANDPYSMYRGANAEANDPYAMYRGAGAEANTNDPNAMYRGASTEANTNDPYAMYRSASTEANANDPFAMFRQAAAAQQRRAQPSPRQQYPAPEPRYEEAAQEERHPLGPRGKTKEGYDCYIGYDRECSPLKASEPRSGAHRRTPYPAEPYEPHLNADGSRNGVLEPSDPHCDPEYDPNCRLRRPEPTEERAAQPEHQAEAEQGGPHYSQGATESQREQYEAEPYQSGQEEPYAAYPPHSQGLPSFQDMLRGYGDQFPEQDDHRAYADDYRKK